MIPVTPWDKKPITMPGIYSGVSIDAYHSGWLFDSEPSLSSTALRKIWQHSAAAYWVSSPFNPARIEEKPNRGMILGAALHHCAQGRKFQEVFVPQPEEVNGEPWQGNRKDCKRWKAQQEQAGFIVVTRAEAIALGGMLDVLKTTEFVQRGGLNGLIECSMFWRDKETGIWLRARPDAIPTDSGNFCDLKKTTSILLRDIANTIATFGYHQQAALVMAGARDLGIPAESFTFLFAESDPPYCAQDATIEGFDLDRGTDQNRIAIRKFEHAWTAYKKNKKYRWPGPVEEMGIGRVVSLPDWARKSIDRRLERELGERAA